MTITGRRWKVGDIAYRTMENYQPPYDNYEIKVLIRKEIIMPKWGRGEEYGYFFEVLDYTKNAPENPVITSVTAGTNFRKNPKMGIRSW